jgi:hypothetical protein
LNLLVAARIDAGGQAQRQKHHKVIAQAAKWRKEKAEAKAESGFHNRLEMEEIRSENRVRVLVRALSDSSTEPGLDVDSVGIMQVDEN